MTTEGSTTAPPTTAPSTTLPSTTRHDLPPLSRDRAVQVWVGASGVSFAGDSVFLIGFAWAAVHEASPALAGFLVGVGMIPQAILLLFGGAVADRFDTRRIVLWGNTIRVAILVAGALAWMAEAPRVPLMFAVALTFGATDAIYNPASATLPRQMVRPEDLGSVSGMFQIARRIAVFGGSALGGWLAAAFGLGVAMLVDAATFAVVGLALRAFVRPRFTLPRQPTTGLLRGIREGLAYLRRDEVARVFVIALTGLNLFIGPALAIGVPLQATSRGWGAGAVGAIEATLGVAAAIGAAVAIRRRPRHDARSGFAILLAQGAGIVALGTPSLPVAIGAAGVIGLTAGSASVLLSGAFQRTLDPAYLGRASSMTTLGDYTLLPAMMPFFGWLAHHSGIPVACAAFGGGMVLLAAWGATRRSLADLTVRAPAER